MSLHDSSYTIECQSDECEIIHVSTTNSSSVVNLSSSLIANSPSATNEFTIIEKMIIVQRNCFLKRHLTNI